MKKRKHESLKLKRDHHWRARPGHRIFVADRGAVRFDFIEDPTTGLRRDPC